MQNILEIKNLSKTYTDISGTNQKILKGLNISCSEGEIISIIAGKNSGKSTLLKIIGRLDEPSEGSVEIKGKAVFIPSLPSSFPWLNVVENIKIVDNRLTNEEINRLLNLVGLDGYGDHHPDNRSLGFRFRISIARALAADPILILIDEPFTEMNEKTKAEIYSLIKRINREIKKGFILTTSKISEAVFLSNKIYLMKRDPGEIIGEIKINKELERISDIFSKKEFIELLMNGCSV